MVLEHLGTHYPSFTMALVSVPIDIARIFTECLGEDNRSLLKLCLVSHDFRYLAEPYLYASVSFVASRRTSISAHVERTGAELSTMADSSIGSIAVNSGWGRYVKCIFLPGL